MQLLEVSENEEPGRVNAIAQTRMENVVMATIRLGLALDIK